MITSSPFVPLVRVPAAARIVAARPLQLGGGGDDSGSPPSTRTRPKVPGLAPASVAPAATIRPSPCRATANAPEGAPKSTGA